MTKTSESFVGYQSLLASGLAFSLMSVCVKKLGGRIPTAELILARTLFSLTITRLLLYKNNINPWGKNKFLLITRGILGTLALICIFKAISYLPLANATVIQYTYPTFTAFFGVYILKERFSEKLILSILIGWAGIIFVAQPEWLFNQSNANSTKEMIIAILGSIFTSLAYICVRKLSMSEHQLVIIHYFPLISLPICLPLLYNNLIMPIGTEWIFLLGIGLFTQLGQIWITKGLSILPASQACSFNYSQVIFASIWGIIIFNERLNFNVAFGGICVLISTLIAITANKKDLKSLNL